VKTKTVRINHFPKPAGIAPYTTGMAEGLAAYAHDVSLVTGLPHYPEGGSTPLTALGGHTERPLTG